MSEVEYESDGADGEWYGSDDEIETATEADVEIDPDDETDIDLVYDAPNIENVASPEMSEYSRNVIVVKADERRMSHIMSQYEFTNIISIRTTQIAKYANCLVDTKGLPSAELQARKELLARKTPLVIRRPAGERLVDGKMTQYVELWYPHEMTIPMQYFMRY